MVGGVVLEIQKYINDFIMSLLLILFKLKKVVPNYVDMVLGSI